MMCYESLEEGEFIFGWEKENEGGFCGGELEYSFKGWLGFG